MASLQKPAKGTKTREHRAKSRQNREAERELKRQSKERDSQKCRWPSCYCQFKASPILESAHLTHKGMGGDPKLIRTTVDSLITLCHDKHRGVVSLDSGDLDIRPITDKGTSGPCEFYVKDVNGWELLARESAIHELERLR